MPRIREYTSQVNAGGSLNTQASAADFGAAVGQGVSDIGQGLYALDKRQEAEAEKLKQEQDRTDIADANSKVSAFQLEMTNQLRESQGTAAPGASGFSSTYLSTYDERSKAVLDSIANPRARQHAQQHIDSFKTSAGARAFDFEKDQQSAFRVTKTVESVDSSAKLVNGDATLYGTQTEQTYSNIDATGLPPDKREQMKTNAKRVLATSAMEGMRARNPVGLTQTLLPDLFKSAYEQPAVSAGADAGGAGTELWSALLGQESGGKQFDASGRPITSKAGAIGIAQVMPATGPEAAKLAGLPWDERRFQQDAGYNEALGKAYFEKQLATNGGDVRKALAAYNGGPGRLQQAVARAQKEGGEWLSYMPAETQDYVAKITSKAGTAVQAPVQRDSQGQPIPQIKLTKDTALQPPQGVDIPAWNDLSLDDQQKFLYDLIVDFNSKVAVDRSLTNDDRKNMHANFLVGNEFTGEAALQSKYAVVYGPEAAQRMIAEDRNAKATGVFTKAIRGRSDAEIASLIGAAPGANSTADDYETRGRMEAAVRADREELKRNPQEYVTRYSTAVRSAAVGVEAARAAAAKDQSPASIDNVAVATQKYITASLAEQRRLGVADPQILSAGEEKLLVAKIEDLAASGQDVAVNVEALYRQYGSYGPTVAAQVAPKVGGLMNVLGSGINPQSAALLVEAHRNKDQLKKTLGDSVKDMDATVTTVMRDYSATLRGVPNGANVQANYQEQIGTLAMARMSKLGESQQDAVKKAYDALVGDKYTMQDGYRVPKELDANVVRDAVRLQMRTLGPNDVQLLGSSTVGNPVDRMDAQLATIRTSGKWVTTSQKDADGKQVEGVTLMVPTPGGWSAVPAADGKPLFRGFGELVLDYQSRGIATSQEALQRGDMRAYDRLRVAERAAQRKAEEQSTRDQVTNFRAGAK